MRYTVSMQILRSIRIVPRSTADLAFIMYYGMRIFIFCAGAVFIVQGYIDTAVYTFLIGLAMLTPAVLKNKYRLYLPFELDLAVVGFLFLTLFLGSLNNFYVIFPWWDIFLHFSSGIIMGSLGFVLVYTLNEQRTKHLTLSPIFISFFSFCFALAMAVLWEIFEYGHDLVVAGYKMQGIGVDDTMGDLIVCTIGALIVASVGCMWMQMRQKIPFTPRLLRSFQYSGNHSIGKKALHTEKEAQ